jgi:hypothetical protein
MQRSAKYQTRASSPGMTDMQLLDFFRGCQQSLENEDGEAAFYFEQIVDHLRTGKPLPTQRSEISRMLGV